MYMIDVHKVDINYKALADAFGNGKNPSHSDSDCSTSL